MTCQRVRPFVAGDIPQVAELHRRMFRACDTLTPELERSYRGFFFDVYLNNPWRDDELGALICEDAGGKIIGFLGVMPRPMRFNGRPLRAAVSSMFMVDPGRRSGLAAVQLLQSFLSGPQDLSYADESTGPSRRLWERLGGATSMLYSMHWIRPLRPAGFLNAQISQSSHLRTLAVLARPFCRVADAAAAHIRFNPFQCARPRLFGETADIRALLECSSACCDSQALRAEYDERSFRWLLDLASHGDALEKVAVRSPSGNVAGWYVYCLKRDRVAEVLQIGFLPNFAKDVIEHLLSHAGNRGAVAVAGRLDPRFVQELGSGCIMRPRYWMLVHSRNSQLLSMIDRGNTHLTRLDGEWCMQFHTSRYRDSIPQKALSPGARAVPSDSAISVCLERGGAEVVDRLGDEWRRLCEESRGHEPFYRPEWVAASLRAFAPRDTVAVVTVRGSAGLRAVLPLIESSGRFCGVPVSRLRGAANAHSCRFEMVRSADAEGDTAVQAVWRSLRELPGWDLIELPYVPEGGALDELAAIARSEGFPVGRSGPMRSPYLSLSLDSPERDPLLYQANSGFRANVRRKERQIRGLGTLALRCVTNADPAALETFYDLERSGWKGREGTAIACTAETRQFYDEIARQAERFGYLRLYFLDFNGRPIAAQFGIRHDGRYFMPKLAFDESYRKFGPGHLLIHAILRDCAEHGLSEYDFTGPWAEYKAKWTSSSRAHFTLTIFRKGLLGSSLHAAKFKVEAGVRDALRPLVRRSAPHQR